MVASSTNVKLSLAFLPGGLNSVVEGDGITPKAIWHVVKAAAKRADIKNLAPHDLRRYTDPGLCRIEYEASAFGAELTHQDDQVDSA
jgi:hypothetical protein